MLEVAYYQPSWIWMDENIIKNLLLFFDGGIALLVPKYLIQKLEEKEEHLVLPLRNENLLHILDPEKVINNEVTEQLVNQMLLIIESGGLDSLKSGAFYSLSLSRMGMNGNQELAELLYKRLMERGLARESQNGFSVDLHPIVRNLILTINSQLLLPYGKSQGWRFSPTTDQYELHNALIKLLNYHHEPSRGQVVSLDLMTLGVDLTGIPLNEILDYRRQNKKEYMRYVDNVRRFTYDLSSMEADEREDTLEVRQQEITEMAENIKNSSVNAWKRPTGFAMGCGGIISSMIPGVSILSGLLQLGNLLAGLDQNSNSDGGVYSFIIKAGEELN